MRRSPPTSVSFSDEKRLLAQAKRNHEAGLSRLKRWFVQKYKLPPSHPLFLQQTRGELVLEIYEDLYARMQEHQVTLEEFDDAGPTGPEARQTRGRLLQELNAVREALGEPLDESSDDPLIDKWERELAEGKIPNLSER